ncbi:uncharacterized protein LOC136091897 [Hydra vulgaris]|uniref:Uncharacterized protein LOC136091897 n=1 Tax=Hydra vulgaris TaxID=6087 RepID=A0ABM4DMA5_HYDVU
MLYNKQIGFKKYYSTDHALTELVTHQTNAFNDDRFTLGVFIDLYMDIVTTGVTNSKLFDTLYTDFNKTFDKVSHRKLALKLEAYDITSTPLKWVISFLTARKQRVVLGESVLLWVDIVCGVLKGSVLGQFYF